MNYQDGDASTLSITIEERTHINQHKLQIY